MGRVSADRLPRGRPRRSGDRTVGAAGAGADQEVLYYAWNGDPKWRLTYHKLPSVTLSPDSISGCWDDDLDVETIAQVITEHALHKAKWTARQARRKTAETGGRP